MFIAIKTIWTWQIVAFMSKILKSRMFIVKLVHPLTTSGNFHYIFNTFGWRMSYQWHYRFIHIFKSVQPLIFLLAFPIVHSTILLHTLLLGNHSMHSSNSFSSVHFKFCALFLHCELHAATHCCRTMLKQYIIPQHIGS